MIREVISVQVINRELALVPALWRQHFPIFRHHPSVIFMDSAATTQKPNAVLNAEREYLENNCANSGRGSYPWAYKTTELVQDTRKLVQRFIGANFPEEIVFTSGATMSLNLVSAAWGDQNLQSGDEILYCPADHRSINAPWFILQEQLLRRDIAIKLIPYGLLPSGEIDIAQISKLVGQRTKLINITHINNVAGVLNGLSAIRNVVPRHTLINLDVAQSISHTLFDASACGADFVSFSGHKAFSVPGIGVLWVRKELHSQIRMVFSGGGQHYADDPNFCVMPELLECGTPNLAGIVSLNAAIEFIENIGKEVIHERLVALTQMLYQNLLSRTFVKLVYPAELRQAAGRCGLVSFLVEGYSSTEIGDYLAANNMYVRHGDHCAGSQFKSEPDGHDSVRVSLHIYNTEKDIQFLCNALDALPERLD